MPRVQTKKFQKGGTLSFLIDNNKFEVDEQSMDANINNFIDSDNRLRKSKDAILAEYNAAKQRLRDNADTGQLLSIDTANDAVIGVSGEGLSNEQRGLNEGGNAAKPGLFSDILGIKNGAAISGTINKFISDSVANAYSTTTKENALKLERETAEKEAQALKDKELQKLNNNKLYDQSLRNLDLGSSLYGVQLDDNGLTAETNYKRYHKTPKNQRADITSYLNNLRTVFNNEGLNSDEFSKAFTGATNTDFNTFKGNLNSLNLDDQKLDIQKAMDSLGLGTQYSTLMNKDLLKRGAESTNTSTNTSSNIGGVPSNTGSSVPALAELELPTEATNEAVDYTMPNNLNQIEANVLQDADRANSPSAMRYDPIYQLGNKQIGAQSFISLYENGKIPRNPNNDAIYQNAQGRIQAYDTFSKELTEDQGINWEKLQGSVGEYNNPYSYSSYGVDDVDSVLQLTNVFTNSKNSNGTYKFGLVEEKLKDGSTRTRYVDKDTEHFGYYKINPNGEGIFYAVDKNGNTYKTINLGKVDSNRELGNSKLGNVLMYSWKSDGSKPNIKPKASKPSKTTTTYTNIYGRNNNSFPTFLPNSYLKPESNKELLDLERKKVTDLKSVIGRYQSGGTLLSNKYNALESSGKTKQAPKKETPTESFNADYRKSNNQARSSKGANIGTLLSSDYKLSEADWYDVGALITELGSAATTLGSGTAAGVVGAGAGIASTSLGWKASSLRGEDTSVGNLALNYGLDLASAIPIVGAAPKIWKTGRVAKQVLPMIRAAAKGMGLVSLADASTKMINGDFSLENINTVASGLKGMMAGRNLRNATVKDPNIKSSYDVKTKDGGKATVYLDPKQAQDFTKANKTGQRKIVSDNAKTQGITDDLVFPKKTGIPGNRRHTLTNNQIPESRFFISPLSKDDYMGESLGGAFRGRRLMSEQEAKDAVKPFKPWTWNIPANRKRLMNENVDLRNPAPQTVSKVTTVTPTTQTENVKVSKNSSSKPFKNKVGDKISSFLNLQRNLKATDIEPRPLDFTINRNPYRGKVQMLNSTTPTNITDNVRPTKPTKVMEYKTPDTSTQKNGGKVQKGQVGLKFNNPFIANNSQNFNKAKNIISSFSTSPISFALNLNGNATKSTTPKTVGGFATKNTHINNPVAFGTQPKTANTGNVLSGLVGKLDFTDKRPTKTISANPLDLSEAARALYNRGVSSRVDTRVEAPLVSNTLEIAPSVKSNIGLRTAYDNAANRIRSAAKNPISSDAGLNLSGRLSAEAKAGEFELQGRVQDSENIARQNENVGNLARQFAANRTAVANQNAMSISQKIQAERGLNNEKAASMAKSVDNYWANMNMKGYQGQRERMGLESQKQEIEAMNTPIGNAIPGLDPTLTTQGALTDLQSKASGLAQKEYTVGLTPEETSMLTTYRNQITALMRNVQKSSIERSLDLLGGKKDLFSFKVGKRAPITTQINKKGGKMTFEEKKALQTMKENNRKEANWIKEYNSWIKNKANLDFQSTAMSVKSANSIINKMYK